MERINALLDKLIIHLENVRIDGLVLYFLGVAYYTYLHYKHDADIKEGLKGENKMWEAPEVVVYYWVQSFPFVLFADTFLGFKMSEGMMYIFTLILFFAIMGRAGIEFMMTIKQKALDGIMRKKEDEKPKEE